VKVLADERGSATERKPGSGRPKTAENSTNRGKC